LPLPQSPSTVKIVRMKTLLKKRTRKVWRHLAGSQECLLIKSERDCARTYLSAETGLSAPAKVATSEI
jgi:hypothetical protein